MTIEILVTINGSTASVTLEGGDDKAPDVNPAVACLIELLRWKPE